MKTFLPVGMLKSICILLSIAIALDYEIWQMDVKTAFLNDHFEESIYMVQPDGFKASGQENKVCKLLKSIYGLKQDSRTWSINKRSRLMVSNKMLMNLVFISILKTRM